MSHTRAPVMIHGSGRETPGTAAYQAWSPAERKSRAIRKTLRIVGTVLAVSTVGLFVHVLLPVFVVVDFVTILLSAFLYMRFLNEEATLLHVEGACPNCREQVKLSPYLNTRVGPEMTVQCPSCGQTARASLSSQGA